MRKLFVLLAALALFGSYLTPAIAQDATPGASGPGLLSGLGLPEFRIVLGPDGAQVPTEVAAGQVLVVVENSLEFPAGAFFIQAPEGVSIDELMMILGPPPGEEEGPPADASPDAAAPTDASPPAGEAPAGEEEMGPPPPLFYETTWGSGVFAGPGSEGSTVLTLTPGEWYVLDDSGGPPTAVQVTGEMPAPAAITADQSIELKNYQMVFPGPVSAGPQIWEIHSSADQPHEMFITQTPRLLTLEEVEVLISLPEDELPPEGYPNPAEFVDMGGIAPVSKDHTVYIELDLAPGTYAAVCFMPDKKTGEPHAMKGMYVVFEVAAEGTEGSVPVTPESDEDTGATPEA